MTGRMLEFWPETDDTGQCIEWNLTTVGWSEMTEGFQSGVRLTTEGSNKGPKSSRTNFFVFKRQLRGFLSEFRKLSRCWCSKNDENGPLFIEVELKALGIK